MKEYGVSGPAGRHRADIDGLRAVAVLSVVVYHLLHAALPGGYLGVDIFFVLSGFLITSIIWREGIDGRFSIVRFYDRRIRRIVPALLAVLVVASAFALWLLLPSDLIGYAKSLLATLAFTANFYFWRDTNYFAAVAEQKPLLHIWSLGVEEQFYILFPLLMAFLARRWPRSAIFVLIGLCLGSLAGNVLALLVDGALPAFFLLPTRAWELGVGALLAVLPLSIRPNDRAAGIVAGVGLVLVLMGILGLGPAVPFVPAALPVVVGTALILWVGTGTGGSGSVVNRALGWRPVVFVGLISYSLYLWHWPIIVFAKYYLVRDLTWPEVVAALALMFACAVLSWLYVERPFRRPSFPVIKLRWISLAGALCLGSVASALLVFDGLPDRLNPAAATINAAVATNYRCPVSEYMAFGLSRACELNLPTRDPRDADVVLIGNSHAQMYAPAWRSILAERHLTGLLIPVSGCLPTIAANISPGCARIAQRNFDELVRLQRARVVVLGLTWWHDARALVGPDGRPLDNAGDAALVNALDDLIARLQRAGKKVVLIGPLAEPGWDLASQMSRNLAFGRAVSRDTFLSASVFEERFAPAIHHFATRQDIGFARPDRVQCRGDRCAFLLEGHSLFADSNHLAAAELPRFVPVLEQALAKAMP